MSTDFICPFLYCLLQHRPKIFSILLKMFSTRNTDKLSEVCLRRTKLSPFIGGVGEKVIFDISSFCSDAGNKRFDHKMIFKPQNGTKDMKKNPNKWHFNHHVDYWSKKKHYGSYSTVHIHCHMSAFLPKLFRHCILYIQRFTQRYMYHEGSMYFQRSWFTEQLPVETV